MAAAAVARFYEGHRVIPTLAGNDESDRVIQALRPRDLSGADEVWITDLSWTQPETAEHLKQLLADGARVYWIDHHRTAVSRADAPEFKVPFTGKVLSERYSAARLVFEYLKRREGELLPRRSAARSRRFAPSRRSPTTTTAGSTRFPNHPIGRSPFRPWAGCPPIAKYCG